MHNQLNLLEKFPNGNLIDGIFLTHAHIGHYTGLMYLGREGLGGNKIKVYALKRMASFLRKNGPWDQLIKLNRMIRLIELSRLFTLIQLTRLFQALQLFQLIQ